MIFLIFDFEDTLYMHRVIDPNECFQTAFRVFCAERHLNPKTTCFYYKDNKIFGSDTFESIDMKEGDVIDVTRGNESPGSIIENNYPGLYGDMFAGQSEESIRIYTELSKQEQKKRTREIVDNEIANRHDGYIGF